MAESLIENVGDGPPMAEGQPLNEEVALQAAQWLTVLMSDDVAEQDRRRWREWRGAHPDHERAWRHIESVTGRFRTLGGSAAYRTLSPYPQDKQPVSPGRRRVLGWLLLAGVTGATGGLGTRTRTWRAWAATYRTGPGEQRSWTLADGTSITLNTDSAVTVDFDADTRRLRLVAGELWVITGHAAGEPENTRPLLVETDQGRVRSLGTRFNVRQWPDRTTVVVAESAVAVVPEQGGSGPVVVRAGQCAAFSESRVEAPRPSDSPIPAWINGQIIAEDRRLEDFLADLGRYRRGVLRCDPAVADLRLSGVFPLRDTDQILASLPGVLPVRVHWRTGYWVTVDAAD
ncbi:transmembrane sensor [Alcanivorax xiamenensis]|uniref:Transmembrane sensor n=1 Tax=Alcanivorax xiamenensis TaxID=1177156 RepID=A0ABQ6Y8S8_9GAMM|nr:FecR domain-containing protein [Alcanivorax xiamenensis]KAF0805667.1 transmembrane sensor [Alcanivorax xiamenensis]